MCGIAGILMRSGTPDQSALETAAHRLRHRGPDDLGIHVEGPLGLIHTRLSIVDLEGGHQPLEGPDGQQVLAANGEIYNDPELRAVHARQDIRPRTGSDSESILHTYALKGIDGIADLHGMFAFALFDRRDGSLLLGRDRLGIKPLFVARLPDRIAFASEIKALLPLLPRQPDLEPGAIAQFLENQFCTGTQTVFRGIERIEPGTCLRVSPELNCQSFRYWSALDVKTQDIDLKEATETFEPLFDEVIREHMRADVPFGLFLSGGVDSSILANELTRRMETPLQTFSVGFKGTRMDDELDAATSLAEWLGTRHTRLELSRDQVFGRLVHSIWATDDLMRDYACLPTSLLSETAARDLKVVFSGEGGDEAFAGYRRYRLSPERRIKALLHPGSGGFRTRGQWRGRRAYRTFGPALRGARKGTRQPFVDAWQATPGHWSDIQRAQYTDLTTALPDNLLVKTDRMTMGFGLEGRVPFCDHRVIEFGLSLPDELKIRGREGKHFLKHWAESRLPTAHLRQPKRGFHVPVGEWFQGEFLDRLGERLAGNRAVNEWFRPEGIKGLIDNQRHSGKASRELWCVMQFAIWHRLFVEGPYQAPQTFEDPLDWIP
ncbi:asparagine synthase (glutamine-hydrolyzing) [Ectothiorhodospira mobilis]|uniref:asparagine synthase (glutamine-hydrolyzing) n=1 Tax=Ectothiorhodospira mobilis TaxID=195064 RepID=UPI001EE8B59D|nr:asparagine synthase (glutamine-hydrolyzing) [Ectothiorhodospira mobilis]MCG5534583.1 asparagine synthase (glutamine-hydrolyzing) [Ectothiorhodospira mobilis]